MAKYLEDIVKEDCLDRVSISWRESLSEKLDMPIVRHPVLSSLVVFGAAEYIRKKYPELEADRFIHFSSQASLYFAYSSYLYLGLVRDYILEGKRAVSKNILTWFLNNPKLVALPGFFFGGFVTNYGEGKMLDRIIDLEDIVLNHAVKFGVLSEVISRGLKNLSRLKKTKVKNRKQSLPERAYNFVFEQPWILPIGVLLDGFWHTYSYRTSYRAGRPSHENMLSGNLLEDIMEKPATMLSTLIKSVPEAVVTFGGMLIISSLLHTSSIKENIIKAKKIYYSILGMRDRALECQVKLLKLPNSTDRTIENTIDLGNMYFDRSDEESAFAQYRKALRLFEEGTDQLAYSDIFRKVPGVNSLVRSLKRRRKTKSVEQRDVNMVFVDLLNKDRSALDRIKQLADENPQNADYRYMYGRALRLFGYINSGVEQQMRAVKSRIRSGIGVKRREGSKNIVIEFEDRMLKSEVIAKHTDGERLIEERSILSNVREIIINYSNYSAPISLGCLEIEGKLYNVMDYASGELLSNIIEGVEINGEGEGNLEEKLMDVTDFMALLHARIDMQLPERDHYVAIGKKLHTDGVDSDTINSIVNNLYPVIKSMEKMPLVYDKDGHPGNWKVGDFGRVVALDFETEHSVRFSVDIAKLLNRTFLFSEQEKRKILNSYIKSFEGYSGRKLPEESEVYLAYLNASIVTALEAYSRVTEQIKLVVLSNARIGIDVIEEEFSEYFIQNREHYNQLNVALAKLNTKS